MINCREDCCIFIYERREGIPPEIIKIRFIDYGKFEDSL